MKTLETERLILRDWQESEHILKKLGFKQVDVLKNVKREVDTEPHDEPYFVLELD